MTVMEREFEANNGRQRQELVTSRMFREAMARIVAPVHIVTTDGAKGRCGFTATAVASITDDPPTVMICLRRSSKMYDAFLGNQVFCINTLDDRAEPLANMFAGYDDVAMDERFDRYSFDVMASGAPALTAAMVATDCKLSSFCEVGTHGVMFGQVVAVRYRDESGGLVYYRRSYRNI